MAHELLIPQLGVTMTAGTITQWLVEDGEAVQEGDVLYTLATDKTETDIESPAAGTLIIVGEVEVEYPVGTVVGRIE
ncbi:dihydrolipoamide acyltransferase [Nocardia nova]|uniref:Dihydrolipoamide acyltransferase n=1 Tax=Nocardia nova TaxID=37330 RepID=A0A2S6APJ1_9NOCA|nr:biotin/lipoyl-containing protein [Nocardia nova]PPJ27858.1 dihydrolipoamide acyltransferase [Nocardia nova]PPJ37191.1 dihydrolipoamide acyltransferase [Nocardia nova]